MSDQETLKHAEQQMLMARPWDAAEPQSLWSITGRYPTGGGFEHCMAMTLPEYVTGSRKPLFVMLPPLSEQVDPAWITHATPLLIVHRDDPTTPYWEEDRVWLA
jgi:hypothetical protein